MTAPTPEQMRALANQAELLQEDSDYDYVFVTGVMTALRAAADQLEGVQAWNHRDGYHLANRELAAILTADTAPQEVDVTTDGIYGVTHFPLKEWTERTDG